VRVKKRYIVIDELEGVGFRKSCGDNGLRLGTSVALGRPSLRLPSTAGLQ
jgi:hypothetical protein